MAEESVRSPASATGGPAGRSQALVPVAAAVAFFAVCLVQAFGDSDPLDFFIFRQGSVLAARGENPYDMPSFQRHVAAHFQGDDARNFVENSGYFLPPMAVLVFLPFAALPWLVAKLAWAAANGLAAYFIARLPLLGRDIASSSLIAWAILPLLLILNPLALVIPFPVGQYSVVFVGCVSAGLLAFHRHRPYLAAAIWVLPFVKPHLAIALLPLAWYLGGWRPAVLLVVLVAVLNAAGATVVGGSPLFLKDYLDYLPAAHKAVAFNRIELNPQVTSWNRLLFAAGGPLIELNATTTVAGYLAWWGLILGRSAATGSRPSPSWSIAATATGSLLVCQALGYETLVLALVVPWLLDLVADRRRVWATLTAVPMLVQLLPYPVVLGWVQSLGLEGWQEMMLLSYRSISVAVLAGVVFFGPGNRGPAGR